MILMNKGESTTALTDSTSNQTHKVCSCCKIRKNIADFYKNKSRIDGLDCYCKICSKVYMQEYRTTHKESILEIKNKWRKNHRIKLCKSSKIFRLSHKKEINKHLLLKRKTDINFQIRCNLRTRLNNALKGHSKSAKTLELLGCNIEFLKVYLMFHFKPGMTWKNHGRGKNRWHIDHIKPCAKFDLSKVSEQRKCFHYTNLQPLWEIENLLKKDKY